MKARTLIGGAVVLAFVFGGYLGGYFPKFGLGTGSGDGPGSGGRRPSDDRAEKSRVAVISADPDAALPSDSQSVLHVRIDGREFFLGRDVNGRSAYSPATLDELVILAKKRPGNAQGVRVRVGRRPNSKTTVEIQLRDALVAAGIDEDAIEWLDGPRP